MGYPTIFPTGTLRYDKEKAWSGYTLFPSGKGALLIDMNGNEVQGGRDLAVFLINFFPEDMCLEQVELETVNMLIRIS